MVLRLTFYGSMTKLRASYGRAHKVVYSARACIEVASHDLLWNYTDVFFLMGFFLGYLPLSYQKNPYIRPDAVGLPSEVAKSITFEEQVTNININKTTRGGKQATLVNYPYINVDHLVSNLCHHCWIKRAHNT
jgi:hypothetical protein